MRPESRVGGGGVSTAKQHCTTDRIDAGLDENLHAAQNVESRLLTILGRLTGQSIPSGAEPSGRDHEGSVFGRVIAESIAISESLQRTKEVISQLEQELGL